MLAMLTITPEPCRRLPGRAAGAPAAARLRLAARGGGGRGREGDKPGYAGYVDDHARALPAHHGEGGLRPVHRSHQIDVERPPELFGCRILEERPNYDPGAVYPAVDPPPPLDRGPGDVADLPRVRDIARHDQDLSAEVFRLPGHRFEQPHPPGGKDHARSLAGERQRYSLAVAAGCTRYDDHPAVQARSCTQGSPPFSLGQASPSTLSSKRRIPRYPPLLRRRASARRARRRDTAPGAPR